MEVLFLIILILLMIISLSSGFPVAFALPGSAIISIALAGLSGYFLAGDSGAYFVQDGPIQWLTAGVTNFRSLYWNVERDTLIAIPLFVFMGIMLHRSKIAEDLLVAMAQLFGPVPGGLGISVVFVGALLAATTGILGATVIAMGLISLPAMMRSNYSKSLATGTICASGSLGQIIPPSIVLIILADQLANAADQARSLRAAEYKAATGEFTLPAELDVSSASAGDMFMGALIPGLILVGLYMLYILIVAMVKPGIAPPVPYNGKYDRDFVKNMGIALIPPLALIFAVLGSIVTGVATVNQAGSIGAVGAIVMGGYRISKPPRHQYTPLIIVIGSGLVIFALTHFFDLNIKTLHETREVVGVFLAVIAVGIFLGAIIWSGWRVYKTGNTLVDVMIETAKTTSMVFIILIGAAMLTAAFRGFGGEHLVKEFLTGLPGGFWTQFITVMLVIFFLGFFLDFIEIAVVVVPIVAPILLSDPSANITAVWLGVMIGLNIQTSFLTPPFGFALFYLRGVASSVIKTIHIYKGVIAFIGLQILGLTIVGFFPSLVNYMPNRTYLLSDTAPPPVNPKLQYCIEKMVFADLEMNSEKIYTSIQRIDQNDFFELPKKYRNPLIHSFDLTRNTFEKVTIVKAADAEIDSYNLTYRPLQSRVRKINNRLKLIDERLKIVNTKIRRLENALNPTQEQREDLAANKYELELHKQLAIESIPPEWESARIKYRQLESVQNKAHSSYRQHVDSAYTPLVEVIHLLEQAKDLEKIELVLLDLNTDLNHSDIGSATIKIPSIETNALKLVGIEAIKSGISNLRKKLNQEPENISSIKEHYDETIRLINHELEWRHAAATLLSELVEYNNAIKSSIGLRQQKRLSPHQAKLVAYCQSEHRDISLRF